MEYSKHLGRGFFLAAPLVRPDALSTVDAKPKALPDRVTLTARLLVEKALFHLDDPAYYPLPADAKSLENVLVVRLKRIAPLRRRRVVKHFLPAFREQRRNTDLGTLACVDLGSRRSLLAQVKARAVFTESEEQALLERIASFNGESDLAAILA